jgi:tRNA threonylcarbamoyladenosine biosynthesis protein TsaE
MNSNNFITKSFEETQKLGEDFIKNTNKRIIALDGELGSGKTTFVQGLARGLGIKNRIISPTFIIIRSYKIKNKNINAKNFYHIDLYRITSDQDVVGMELSEIIHNPSNLVAIEWPERIAKILPKDIISINLRYLDDDRREIRINE